jgi:hypothetical protein
MMTTNRKLYARTSALPAIAAAMALLSTPVFAQEAQPVTAEPPPAAAPTPVTTPDEPAAATDSSTTATPPTDTSTAPGTTTTTTRTVKHTSHAAAKPATAKPATTTRTSTTRTVTRAAVPAAPAATAATTPLAAPAQPTASQSAVTPVVDLNSKPAAPVTAAATKPAPKDDTLPIAAGGALALLALGAGALALSRRRRRQDEQAWIYDEEPMAPVETVVATEPRHDPIIHEEQPAIVAPSAFAWGNEQRQPADANEPIDEDDRMPGESWVQRAYRGPTSNNPSVSLRARLKRAAFFDKREREVAAGTAEPVDMDAGLPEAMVDEQDRELA